MTTAPASAFTPGTMVRDRDETDPNNAVVIRQLGRADEVTVPIAEKPTVADLNPDYPSDADVVEVAFVSALEREVPKWREFSPAMLAGHIEGVPLHLYSYPTARLRRAADGGTWG